MRIIVWTIKDLAEMIKRRQQNEFDVTIAVDGARGNGKSTLTYKVLTKVGNFNPEKDLLFTRDDVMDAIKNRKFSCIDADEMINSAHNRDFFSGDQKNFIKLMNMYRDNYNILMGSSPFFYDLDPQIRKLIKIRITVVKRGVAILQMAKNSLYINDPWETDINKKIEMSWINKLKRGKLLMPKYQRLTTYAGHIFYNALTPQQELKYKALKVSKRSELNLDSDTRVKPYWEDANETIELGKIKSFKELRFYLMGKGIMYSKGLAKINLYRKDMGFVKTLKDMFYKEEDKPEFVEVNEGVGTSMAELIS